MQIIFKINPSNIRPKTILYNNNNEPLKEKEREVIGLLWWHHYYFSPWVSMSAHSTSFNNHNNMGNNQTLISMVDYEYPSK